MIKKFIILALAFATLFMTMPAQAGDEGAAIIGGVIGGLILGDILSHNERHHAPRRHGQYYEDYNYYSACWTEKRREWDPYRRMYYIRYVRFCD